MGRQESILVVKMLWKAKGPQSTGSGRSRIETGVRTLKLQRLFNIGN